MKTKLIWLYFIYLLLAWGSFRYWVKLPEAIEELWFKPLIWLVPVFWWRLELGGRPKFFGGGLRSSFWWGVVFAVFYFGVVIGLRGLGNVNISWTVLLTALATSVVEELTFSGFILGYLDGIKKNKVANLLTVAVMVMLVRLPISLWIYHLTGPLLWATLFLSGTVAMINGWLRQRTDNVMTAIVARMGMMIAVLG